jgi:hypothetical protein
MTKPEPYGHWMLSTNHLDVKKPAPQLWTTWDDDMTIADIASRQDYKLPKRMTCYPVTLIYYPTQPDPDSYTERSFSLACSDDTLLPQASSCNTNSVALANTNHGTKPTANVTPNSRSRPYSKTKRRHPPAPQIATALHK